MKRKLFLGLASLAIMAVAICVTVSSVNANSTESDLLSQNLEALTRGESGFDKNYTASISAYGITWPCCISGGSSCTYVPCSDF